MAARTAHVGLNIWWRSAAAVQRLVAMPLQAQVGLESWWCRMLMLLSMSMHA
jgi:hypothetical protein